MFEDAAHGETLHLHGEHGLVDGCGLQVREAARRAEVVGPRICSQPCTRRVTAVSCGETMMRGAFFGAGEFAGFCVVCRGR